MAAEQVGGPGKNLALIAARRRRGMPSGEPMQPQDVADEMNAFLWMEHQRTSRSTKPTILDHRFVLAYEAGRHRWPSAHYRAAFRHVLRVATDAELGFTPRRRPRDRGRPTPPQSVGLATGASSTATNQGHAEHQRATLKLTGRADDLDIHTRVPETDSVQRRTVLTMLAHAAAGSTLDRAGLARLVAGSSLTGSGRGLGNHWKSIASEYGHSYLSSPRNQIIRELTMDLAILELTLPRAKSEPASRDLNEAGARIAALLAMAYTDRGCGSEARHSWLLARRLSDASQCSEVRLWVRGQEALLGIYSGRPIVMLERLIADGLNIESLSAGTGTADLLAAQAQIFALQDRTRESLKSLDNLAKTFDALPAVVAADADSAYSWPEYRLHHTESFVHSLAGSARKATSAQDRALALYPVSRVISRCQLEMHRSVALVRGGEITAGMNHAAAELRKVSPNRRGNFVLTVARQVALAIPPSEAERPRAKDFRSLLSEFQEQVTLNSTED